MSDLAVLKELKNQELFNEVKTGMRCVRIDGRTFFFKFPDASLSSNAQLYEKEMLLQYQGNLPSSTELIQSLARDKNIDIPALKEQEERIMMNIAHFKLNPDYHNNPSYRFYVKQLASIREKLAEVDRIQNIQKQALAYCLDIKVRQATYLFYLLKCTYIKKGDKFVNYFDTVKFSSEKDRNRMANKLFEPFIEFLSGFGESELRGLARSHMVMNLFKIANNTGAPMFAGAAADYNVLQNSLLFWCNYYHSVFQNLGSPEPHVLDDDRLFDQWVQNKINEIHTEAERRSNGSSNPNERVSKHKFRFSKPTRAG